MIRLLVAVAVAALFSPSVATASTVYWGAEIRDDYGYCPQSTAACDTFEANTGKQMSEVRVTYSVETNTGACTAVPTTNLSNARSRGYVPNMNLALQRLGGGAAQTDWQLADITAGNHDTCLHQTAQAIAAWGHPLWLRMGWEMNISGQFPWQVKGGWNGNTVAQFIPAWKHVVDLFRADGATNVTWFFVPNVDPTNVNTPYSSVYPGSSYVDWIGLDGYNNGGSTFTGRFGASYDRLVALAAGKPFGVAETGTVSGGKVSDTSYINGMFSSITSGRYPQLHYLNWSNYVGGTSDWRLEANPQRLAAFKAGIADSRYAAGGQGGLDTSPIPANPL